LSDEIQKCLQFSDRDTHVIPPIPDVDGVHPIDFALAAQVRTSMSKYSQQRMSTSGTEAYVSPEQWLASIWSWFRLENS